MENTYDELQGLIKEGKEFTFENFCYQNKTSKEFGGVDTHEWLEWKSKAYAIVKKLNADSLATKLVEQGIEVKTKGSYSNNFEEAKGKLLQALMTGRLHQNLAQFLILNKSIGCKYRFKNKH